jgi:hypothetical protein
VNLVQAKIVSPALEQGELRTARQRIGQRVDQPGQIAIDELALQGDRGRGHHDGGLVADRVDDRGHQIRE